MKESVPSACAKFVPRKPTWFERLLGISGAWDIEPDHHYGIAPDDTHCRTCGQPNPANSPLRREASG